MRHVLATVLFLWWQKPPPVGIGKMGNPSVQPIWTSLPSFYPVLGGRRHTAYFCAGGATTLILIVDSSEAVSSFVMPLTSALENEPESSANETLS